jgi:hypothetical protein
VSINPHISRAYGFESKESQNDFFGEAMIANQVYGGLMRGQAAGYNQAKKRERSFFVRHNAIAALLISSVS